MQRLFEVGSVIFILIKLLVIVVITLSNTLLLPPFLRFSEKFSDQIGLISDFGTTSRYDIWCFRLAIQLAFAGFTVPTDNCSLTMTSNGSNCFAIEPDLLWLICGIWND